MRGVSGVRIGRNTLIPATSKQGRKILRVRSRESVKSSRSPARFFADRKREECNGAWKSEWWSVSVSAYRGGIGYCFGPLFPKQTASTLFRQEILCSARQAGRTGNGLLSVLLFVINTGSRRRCWLQRGHNSRRLYRC